MNLDSILETIGAAAKGAVNSVSTEVSIAAEEQKIRDAYQAIGRLYYSNRKTGKALTGEAFDALVEQIAGGLQRINRLRSGKNVRNDAADEDFVEL